MFSNKFEKVVSLLLVFLIPSQLALHFWPHFSFVLGIRVDYLSPTIYFTDILAFILFVPWLITKWKLPEFTLLFLTFAAINILVSAVPQISFYKWIKVIEIILLGIYIRDRKKEIGESIILRVFFISLIAFSVIGILQFLSNQSFGRELYLLGARLFNLSTPGIALTDFFGQHNIRAYSTFSHPNALAGYLGAGILFILFKGKSIRNRYFYLILAIPLLCFFLTFSFAAVLGLSIVAIIYLFPKATKYLVSVGLLLSFTLPLMSFFEKFGTSYSERLDLAKSSFNLIRNNFLLGVGLNNFIVESTAKILQPVHNIFLLIVSEVGVVGGVGVYYVFQKALKSKYFLIYVFIFITSLFDHYWATSQQNLLLLSFLFGMLH